MITKSVAINPNFTFPIRDCTKQLQKKELL